MLADGIADGSVRRTDLDVLAMTMVVTVSSYIVSARLLDSVGRSAALEELTRLLDGWLRP
jgi:hypothetical protein